MGGKYKCSYTRANLELVLDLFIGGHPQQAVLQVGGKQRLPIAFRYMKNVGHFYIQPRRDLMQEKAGFGHCCTKSEIYIAGGQDARSSETNRVESYDIKRDTWKNMPPMRKARLQPAVCMFRQRYLYVFGGANHSELKEGRPRVEAKFVSTIERLDVREGIEWEVISVKTETAPNEKIAGHSMSALQISATELLIFGSYFKC